MNKEKIAKYLMQIKAVELNTKKLFTWASGLKSPIYCDNRKILSYPKIRTLIKQEFAEYITKYYPKAELIAGVATGGIAIGALTAEMLNLPFVYVRPKMKQHGLQNQIEGLLPENAKTVVIEDLISTGGSSLNAINALRNAKANVMGLISIFTYNLPIAEKNFKDSNCETYSLTDFNTLIKIAAKQNYIKQNEIEFLNKWKKEF